MTDTCNVYVALYPVEYCLKSVEKYSEGKIHKGEVEARNDKLCKY